MEYVLDSKSYLKKNGFEYFVFEPVYYKSKPYRVILVIENGFNYLGVVNIFRVKEKKNAVSK